MKHLLSTLLVTASMSVFASGAFAQQAKVIKVKGQQAIVQFPNGTVPVVGELINLSGGGTNAETGAHVGNGSREHYLGVSADLGAYSSSANGVSGSKTIFDLQGRFGWNLHIMEFGPIVALGYKSLPGETDTTLGAGGFFDFNFVPNVSGTPFIYGVGVEASYGQTSQTLGGGTATTIPTVEFLAAGNVKYFGLNDHVAIRGDAGFDLQKTSPPTGGATTLTGLLIRGGVYAYF